MTRRSASRRSGIISGTLLIAILAPVGGLADFAPAPGSYELDQLFAKSDAVCVGQLQHTIETVTGAEGNVRAVSRTVGLLAHRCYKGGVSAEDRIEYTTHVPGEHTTDPYLPDGGEVLVFLKETRPHVFTLAFPFFGSLSDASLGTLAPETGAGVGQLQRDIVASTKGVIDQRVLDGNFRVLHGFSTLSEEALTLLRSYSRSVEPDVAMGAFAALAKFGSPADLLAFCDYVNAAGGATAAAAQGYFNFVSLGNIRRPDARGALECLARAPLAVITLWEIVRRPDEVGPSMPMFEQDKNRFIQSWKQWWSDKGHTLYPDGAKR